MSTKIQPDEVIKSFFVEIPDVRKGVRYGVKIRQYKSGIYTYEGEHWKDGQWKKIPCSTRTEENRFPQIVASVGTALVNLAMQLNPKK